MISRHHILIHNTHRTVHRTSQYRTVPTPTLLPIIYTLVPFHPFPSLFIPFHPFPSLFIPFHPTSNCLSA
ncbi:hypothetical protein B484DRAFT_237154 [Ochromonadaceae sp. CCMP2298]|nr:hypothetical protein B484DRAFT_237154 [Ochromonadaceae sp. CCMP2298]